MFLLHNYLSPVPPASLYPPNGVTAFYQYCIIIVIIIIITIIHY